MIFNFIEWSVSPEIFRVGNFAIRWYGLLFALSFVVGYYIMSRIFRNENIPIKVLDQLATYMLVSTIIGARLGHCLFYEPEYYLSNPINILKVWEGGLASHGAAIGILIGLYFFSKKNKKSYMWTVDRIIITVALAGFFIRMGNLFNSEIYGHPTNLPWAFIFIRDDSIPRHPTQLYEGLSYLAIFFYLFGYYWKKKGKIIDGFLFSMFLILVFTARFIIEFFKEPQVGFENNMTLNMGQLLSIPFVAVGAGILIWSVRNGKKQLNKK
jgi:phosphatidylglycerol:prolipoprotein diacylglycerol transferase